MSSFFPREEASSLDDKLNCAMSRILHAATNPSLVEFPDVTRVLWCGEAVDHPFYMQPSDCLPKLFLGLSDIYTLLSQVQDGNVEVTNTLNAVDVYHASSFKQANERDSGKYFFALPSDDRAFASNSVVSVPLTNSLESGGQCSFDQQSTVALIRNLVKSLRYGKEFSLKSCYRIRAIGHARNGYSQHNVYDVYGRLAFEAVCPNIAFRATPIRTLPIVPSPLFNELTRSNPRQKAPKMGYLTLNQSRKLVPMMENDPSVSMTPLVGVWIRFGHLTSEPLSDNCNLLKHPFSWGACVRYLCNEAIQDRRFADQETFVVVIIVAGVELEFYEVCRMVDIVEGMKHVVSPLTLRTEDFLCSELTVDLATHVRMTGEEYIIGQFRPQTSGASLARQHREHKLRAAVDSHHSTAVKRPSSVTGRPQPLLFEGETVTPSPRNTLPTPLSYSRSPSSSSSSAYPLSSSGAGSGVSLRGSFDLSLRRSTDKAAAELISAQQRQIDMLTQEVQRLSQLIEKGSAKKSPIEVSTPIVVDRSVDAQSVVVLERFASEPRDAAAVEDTTVFSERSGVKESEPVVVTGSDGPKEDASLISRDVPPSMVSRSNPTREDDSVLSNVSEEYSEMVPQSAYRRSAGFVSHDRLTSFGRPTDTSASYSRTMSSHIRPEPESILAICAKYGKF